MKNQIKQSLWGLSLLLFFSFTHSIHAQTVTIMRTAADLASTLAGPGVTVSGAVLHCDGACEASFTGVAGLGFTDGILLTSGVAPSAFAPASTMAFGTIGTPGDPDLTALTTAPTFDACVLEFDFVPLGTNIDVKYVFGSEEYTAYTCSPYNDVFGFFISGGAYTAPTNIALVPGTAIPVCINSVNCGASAGWPIADCIAMGAGSPFCAYYVNNAASTSIAFDGLTTVLTAHAAVVPCTRYHLKLAVADVFDEYLDSGVFLKEGSLTATGSEIVGAGSVCVGAATPLTDPVPGGTWSSSDPTIATVGATTGIVTGVAAGVCTISYRVGTDCIITRTETVIPPSGPIAGPSSLCAGDLITLTDAVGGGTWTSSNIAIATVGVASGIVTGIAGGTATISYTTICGTVTKAVTVNPLPVITGTTAVCIGATITLIGNSTGGTWTSSDATIATVGLSTGIVTGITAGTTIITYTTGCGYTTTTVTVKSAPAPVTGTFSFCEGATTLLADVITDGTWSSASTGIATVGATTGLVYGASEGTAVISYTNTCGTVVATVTVNPLPDPITGVTLICGIGTNTLLADAIPGGTWSSSDPSIATVDATGLVTGVSYGVSMITYANSCGLVTVPVTVDAVPTPSIIPPLPTPILCVGGFTDMTLDPGTGMGYVYLSWTSTDASVAAVSHTFGDVFRIFAIAPGTATITVTVRSANGCIGTVSYTVTVYAPPVPISGSPLICGIGSTTTLSDPTAGGVWSSSNPLIATVDAAGVVTGVAYGTAIISYENPCGLATLTVTVNPVPMPFITPNPSPSPIFCEGGATYFSVDPGVSGAYTYVWWTSSDYGVATVAHTTVDGFTVTGVGAGTAVISIGVMSATTGCVGVLTYTVTINPSPAPISGSGLICGIGSSTTLTDATAGGTWSSRDPSIASVDPFGVVTGMSAGTTVISYSNSYDCAATITVTVVPKPNVCVYFTCSPLCFEITSDIPGVTVLYEITPDGTTWTPYSTPAPITLYGGSSLPIGTIAIRLVSVTYMGCTWPLSCTASVPVHRSAISNSRTSTSQTRIVVVPNPNNGDFNVQGELPDPSGETVNLELTDVIGRVIFADIAAIENGKLEKTIKIGKEFASGIYLLKVNNQYFNQTFRIVVER